MAVEIDLVLPRDTRDTALPTTQRLSLVPRRLAHLPISTEVKFTEALSGGRALTAPRTGRWLRRVSRCLRLSAVWKPRRYPWCSWV